MNEMRNPRKFTPFGVFMYQYCKKSELGLAVMNNDYVLHDWKQKKVMIFEEKMYGERTGFAQDQILLQQDAIYRYGSAKAGVDFWGIFKLRFPENCTHVGPGITLNGIPVTVEQLVRHINFEDRIVSPANAGLFGQETLDGAEWRRDKNGHP